MLNNKLNSEDIKLSESALIRIFLINRSVSELRQLLKIVLEQLKDIGVEVLDVPYIENAIHEELLNCLIDLISENPDLMSTLGFDLTLIDRKIEIFELQIDPDKPKAEISKQGDHFCLENLFSISSPTISMKGLSQFLRAPFFDKFLLDIEKITGLKRHELMYKYNS